MTPELISKLMQLKSSVPRLYEAYKPSFFGGVFSSLKWRQGSMFKTLDAITKPESFMALHERAALNLSRWLKEPESSPRAVEVVHQDWGLAALNATRKYGKSYAVLNMAHPVHPGGAFLKGGNAQEEDMWHRSTCALSLADDVVYLDESAKMFYYNRLGKELLEAKAKMTDAELVCLRERLGKTDTIAHKVFFSRVPRVCFRGPEEAEVTGIADSSSRSEPDKARSYAFLPNEEIFPFYELRSAAPEVDVKLADLDEIGLARYESDLRQRIAAQLDTLIVEGQRNVILGAWGCGVFKNDPHIVAKIYCEEIEKRASSFDHILFPIINIDSLDKYAIFHKLLSGIKLGSVDSLEIGLKP